MSGVIWGYGDMDLRIIKRLRPLARTTSQIPAHRPYPRFLLAPLENNGRYRRLPRLAVQIICPLGRQVQQITAEADGPPHRHTGAYPNFGRGLLIHLRVGRRGEGGKSIQRPRRFSRRLQLRRILPPSTGRQESPETRPCCTRSRLRARPESCPPSPGSPPSIWPHSEGIQRAPWPRRSKAQ